MKKENIAEALNLAIWLRDNCDHMSLFRLREHVVELGGYGVFSAHQIRAIVNKHLSHSVISKLINKTDKTGGALNPGTLDILRNVLYNRAENEEDYNMIKKAFGAGTSQNMISKLTGIPQSTISKKLRSMDGK